MVDRIVHRTEMRKTIAWLLRFFATAGTLPQKPRRRAGESLARFRAASLPIATALPPAPPGVPGPNGSEHVSPSISPSPPPAREVPIEE